MSATVLFDAPGPRARMRHRILTGVGLLIAVGIAYVVLRKLGDAGQLAAEKWKPFVTKDAWTQYLLPGIWGTVKAAVISIVLAAVFGTVFGMGRLSDNRGIRWVSGVVVEFFRAVPVLIMMYFAFNLYARNNVFAVELNPLMAVVTGLTLYNGSVLAELVRSGVHGLPAGQREAGLSIGLTQGQTLRSILLPQALRAMLPALIGQCVVVLKDSALGYGITYAELLSWSKTLGSAYANTIPAYMAAAVLFILMNFALTFVARKVEARLGRRGVRPTPAAGTAVLGADAAAGGNPAGPSTAQG
ncbi:putative glutamate transporter permease protein (gluD) [Nostocoides japonicum T1-X7]|uniref:Putative glutamate transporter permease protein (GluD) n=1 Tax=Nostocoides japonicum T1-X7 TaxID=1194083 RepID=A0A077M0C1_9MICO|nr:amino acid ABC transporter permease [Tetrasphaera japonica]CCH78567.1 putative glutamate transporter permease protein (gluD) [Tetrasphaera japonica T1-X7]